MTDTIYKPRQFDGGTFTNDQRTGEHVSNIDLERDAGGFRQYRIGLHSEYTPIINVVDAATVTVKDDHDWHMEACTIVFDDGCDMTAVFPPSGHVIEVMIVRWSAKP